MEAGAACRGSPAGGGGHAEVVGGGSGSLGTWLGGVRRLAALALLLVAAGCGDASNRGTEYAWLMLGPGGERIARAITGGDACPALAVDGREAAMAARGGLEPPLFPVLTCEASILASATRVAVDGVELPLNDPEISRIAVLGELAAACRPATPRSRATIPSRGRSLASRIRSRTCSASSPAIRPERAPRSADAPSRAPSPTPHRRSSCTWATTCTARTRAPTATAAARAAPTATTGRRSRPTSSRPRVHCSAPHRSR